MGRSKKAEAGARDKSNGFDSELQQLIWAEAKGPRQETGDESNVFDFEREIFNTLELLIGQLNKSKFPTDTRSLLETRWRKISILC